jgi:ABC-type Fe3+-siderophore transport system permease subunit
MGQIDQQRSVSRYSTPNGGGLIGVIALIGMAVMLLSDGFARSFLSFSIPAGGLIALVLYWGRRRTES